MKKQHTAESYILSHPEWQGSLALLRKLNLSAGLTETIKWGIPVYTMDGKNVAGIAAFKSYAGIWFFQGALLKDEKKLLVNAQKGKTRAMRQLHFGSLEEIDENVVKAYLAEAIRNQKQGRELKPLKNKPLVLPDELKALFAAQPDLLAAFEVLSLSKKREYAEYIAEARKPETREKRLDKIITLIRNKKGLNDQYRK